MATQQPEGASPLPQSVTAKRVRVSVDAKSGTALVTLQRDGVTVQINSVTARGGVELAYLFPHTGADPELHEYVLTAIGDAVIRLGGALVAEPSPIKLTVDTTEEELQLPQSEGDVA